MTKKQIKTTLLALRRRAAALQAAIGDKKIRRHFVTVYVTRMNAIEKYKLPHAFAGVHADMWRESIEFELEQTDALLRHTETLVQQHPKEMKVRTSK